MIRSVRSNKATFRPVKFEPGFNVVLADRTDKSSQKDSRTARANLCWLKSFTSVLAAARERVLKRKNFATGGSPSICNSEARMYQ